MLLDATRLLSDRLLVHKLRLVNILVHGLLGQ